ncbi:aminodeoxychorismate lyase [Lysobacter sp. CA199]|uniref:aminodeoxychorismate lyase n=1 Tax=Lysobacter sp. CA199 TaxID=3455608 RepID=UPI003F8D6043
MHDDRIGHAMNEARIFRGGERVDALSPYDRGHAYGDGLFETLLAHRGELPWWGAHWARLARGAQRIGLPLPDPAQVRCEAAQLLEDLGAVLKLILTRGEGGRGYAPSVQAEPVWTISRHPVPPAPRAGGLNLRWCDLRLSEQPALAGLKHCNRLEQVLARAEWDDPAIDEGLLRNAAGEVVCATAANVFALIDGQWRTPPLERCGVAGICREFLIPLAQARVERLSPEDLQRADAIFLCNAVRGILPVARLGERHWAPHPALAGLRRRLGAAHPALVPLED